MMHQLRYSVCDELLDCSLSYLRVWTGCTRWSEARYKVIQMKVVNNTTTMLGDTLSQRLKLAAATINAWYNLAGEDANHCESTQMFSYAKNHCVATAEHTRQALQISYAGKNKQKGRKLISRLAHYAAYHRFSSHCQRCTDPLRTLQQLLLYSTS